MTEDEVKSLLCANWAETRRYVDSISERMNTRLDQLAEEIKQIHQKLSRTVAPVDHAAEDAASGRPNASVVSGTRMVVRVRKLRAGATLPSYSRDGDAGLDSRRALAAPGTGSIEARMLGACASRMNARSSDSERPNESPRWKECTSSNAIVRSKRS